jgi:integrase
MQETTKNGDVRIIPILPEVREVLLRLMENEGDFIFGGKENLDSSHFSRQLKAELKNHPNLPQISFHKLRHSFCSYLDSTGMNRRIVSQILGHRQLSTTDRYSHINDNMLGNEMNRWLDNQNQQKTAGPRKRHQVPKGN